MLFRSLSNIDTHRVIHNAYDTSLRMELPFCKSLSDVIFRTGFSFLYNEKHEQSNWVAYELTKKEVKLKVVQRQNKFLPDPLVVTGSATNADYLKSGFDRGHLAPAADMQWSQDAMAESFFYSNICPQIPNFNRGAWKQLEEITRRWALENESIYVVTGPVLTDSLRKINNSRVSIPNQFFKVILEIGRAHV